MSVDGVVELTAPASAMRLPALPVIGIRGGCFAGSSPGIFPGIFRESFGESLLVSLLVSLCLIDAGGLECRRFGTPENQKTRKPQRLKGTRFSEGFMDFATPGAPADAVAAGSRVPQKPPPGT